LLWLAPLQVALLTGWVLARRRAHAA
jgi:hypothetical protein